MSRHSNHRDSPKCFTVHVLRCCEVLWYQVRRVKVRLGLVEVEAEVEVELPQIRFRSNLWKRDNLQGLNLWLKCLASQ